MATAILIGTRKGAFIVKGDKSRERWKLSDVLYHGHIVHHFVQDPRDPKTLLIAARTGHLGHTLFHSNDQGKTWKESKRPPMFPKVAEGETGRAVDHVFWLTAGHASEPGVWYAGTSPQGIFRSEDGGRTWDGIAGFNESPDYKTWCGEGTPDGAKLHSVIVDPRDAAHLYIGMSSGGVMESTDAGRTWTTLLDGLEVVKGLDPKLQVCHDPHCIRLHPANPDRLWMQNHCGIYRIDRPSAKWKRVGKAMPKDVGDVGFPIVVHPRDPDTAWVFPMDGTDVWPRTSPGGHPAVFVTRDGGKTWQKQAKGLPKKHAWLTVKRQAMTVDDEAKVGVYFGTTSGEIWASANEGRAWSQMLAHLPHVYSLEAAKIGK